MHGLSILAYNLKIRPDPTPGKTLELGFLGTVLHVEIPHSIDSQQVTATSSFNEKYDPKSHVGAVLVYVAYLGAYACAHRFWLCRRLSPLLQYFCLRRACRIYGPSGNVWSYVNLFLYSGRLQHRLAKQSGGCVIFSDLCVSFLSYVSP